MSVQAPKRNPIPFGTYLLLDRINIGGMAEVWRGKSFGAGGFERLVAIKRILPNIAEDAEFKSMFIDEAKISVLLAHANIAQTYDLGELHQSLYIAMEYVAGKDLRVVFDRARKQKAPLPIPLVCHVLLKACEGLDHAHRKKDQAGRDLNIVHRDVSPQNILLSYDGEVKVIDFGIAKAAGKATTTQAGVLKGKFGYMSPEQILGQPLDRRSDVFALGVCLHELLCAERLFVGDSDHAVLEKVRNVDLGNPASRPALPPELERILLRALARDPAARYQYASDMADELERYLIGSGHFFGRKDLMEFMHSAFAEDMEKEQARQREYATVQATPEILASLEGEEVTPVPPRPSPERARPPTPAPPPPKATTSAGGEKTTIGRRPTRHEDDGEHTTLDLRPIAVPGAPGGWERDPPTVPLRSGAGAAADDAGDETTASSREAPVGRPGAARGVEDEVTAGARESMSARGPGRGPLPFETTGGAAPRTRAERSPRPEAAPRDLEPPTVAMALNVDAPPLAPRSLEIADEPTPVGHRADLEDAAGEDEDGVAGPLPPARRTGPALQRPRSALRRPSDRGRFDTEALRELFDAQERRYTRRDLWLAAGAGALLALVLGLLGSVLASPAQKGTVVVEVFGIPAPLTTVRLDGRALPTAAQFPMKTEAPLGTVHVEVSAAGYQPSLHVVQLKGPGDVAEVRTRLEPLPR